MAQLPSTHLNNLQKLRGRARFQPKNADGTYQTAINLSPSSELTVTMATETSQYISQESGIAEALDTTLDSVARTGKLVCNNMSNIIKAMFLIGSTEDVAQAADIVTEELSDYVFPNTSIQLGGETNNGAGIFGVSAVTVSSAAGVDAATRANTTPYALGAAVIPATPNLHWYMAVVGGTSSGTPPTFPTNGSTVTDGGVTWKDMGLIEYVADTDYELDTAYGLVNVLSTGAIATAIAAVPASLRAQGLTFRLSSDYTLSAQTVPQVATQTVANLEGKFWFYEDNPKGKNSVWYAPRATLAPDGDFALKSGADYGALGFALSFEAPPTGSALYINEKPVNVV